MLEDPALAEDVLVWKLPRATSRGNPPTMAAPGKTLARFGVRPTDLESPYLVLRTMYLERLMSQAKIAQVFGVQDQTIARWLGRLGIPARTRPDSVSLALTIHQTRDFRGDRTLRAYLLGLRAGDLHAQPHGRKIRVSVGTTHPAMADLFHSVFSQYGEVRRYPKHNGVSGYHWCIYSDLNLTFDFLLRKPEKVPDWVLEDQGSFCSFLAGYFDAEGCISFNLQQGCRGVVLIVGSCDLEILKDVHAYLTIRTFHPTLRLSKKAGEASLKSDFWKLRMSTKEEVLRILNEMPLKHSEKVAKKELANFIHSSGWRDGWQHVRILRASIAADVRHFKTEARDAMPAKGLP